MKIKGILIGWLFFLPIDFALAMLSLQVRDPWSLSSLVWFPAGVVQGIICSLAPRYWLFWLLPQLALNLLASQFYNRPVNVSLIFSGINILSFVVIGLIWQFFYGVKAVPKRVSTLINLIILCLTVGILERLAIRWMLYLFNYPTDLSISFVLITGYIFSFIPLMFFTIYLIHQEKPFWDETETTLLFIAALAAMAALFIYTPIIDSEIIHYQLLAVAFSFCLPVLLSLTGNLMVTSCFLSCCSIGVVGLTLFELGPFATIFTNTREEVQMASSYIMAFSLPALLISGYVNTLKSRASQIRNKQCLMASMLPRQHMAWFHLQADGTMQWQSNTVWQQRGSTPQTWSLFLAWIHPDDRKNLDDTRNNPELFTQKLSVRLADNKGEYQQIDIGMIPLNDDPNGIQEGVLHEQ